MMVYTRDIKNRLFLVRILSALILGLIIYLFYSELREYGAVLVALLLIGTVFSITGLIVYSNKLIVKQYFFFGWIWRTRAFQGNYSITLTPFEIEMDEPATSGTFNIGTWRSISIKKFIIKQVDEYGNRTEVEIMLSAKEVELINKYFPKKEQTSSIDS